jgi:hypothetical protein
MRSPTPVALIVLTLSILFIAPVAAQQLQLRLGLTTKYPRLRSADFPLRYAPPIEVPEGGYVFVGGQNGSWFQQGQYSRLYQISLPNYSYTTLNPVRSGGTVWGGAFNGTQLLVSGWGTDDDSPGPYIWLYDGARVVSQNSLDDYGDASSWSGGDIFAASYNGKTWLLSGLGSGALPGFSAGGASNHMALGIFNGVSFTDLSSIVPDQQDAILYANAWNGQYWLVGGGWLRQGELFTLSGDTHQVNDLLLQATEDISNFTSVQSLAWNGNYWLIGGMGFLAEYDGHHFIDLTKQLEYALGTSVFYSVNSLAWNGQSWLIGGGMPIAQLGPSHAWAVVFARDGFRNLASSLPASFSNRWQNSSILGVTAIGGTWVLGGYVGNRGFLASYSETSVTDCSYLVDNFTYVDWVSSIQALMF